MTFEIKEPCQIGGKLYLPGGPAAEIDDGVEEKALRFEIACRVGRGLVVSRGKLPADIEKVASAYALWRDGQGKRPVVADLEAKKAVEK